MDIGLILLILLIVLLIGALPAWPHSSKWGYRPSGVIIILIVILLIAALSGHVVL